MHPEWQHALADGDVVVVRDDAADGPRFIVYGRGNPRSSFRSYAEAEQRACADADRARAHAWYADGRGLQLIGHRGERR